MSWQSRLVSPEERERYDRFVANHPRGHILQSFEWGEVKAGTGWRPLRLLVEDGGEPIAALSILERRLPVLPRVIFYAPRGPVADLRDERLLDFLFQAAADLAARRGAILLKLDPDVPEGDEPFRRYLERAGFRPAASLSGFEGVQPRHVFRLDISPPEEELLAGMHPKTRYNLRLAEKKGVTVRAAQNRDADLPVFYRILLETARRDHFLVRSYGYFVTLWDCLVERGLARLFLAEYGGEAIAGALAFTMGRKAWYIYGASASRHRNVMPNYLVQWTMIRWAKSIGCTMYDFRGVPGILEPDHPLYGLYRFKKGFGGEYTTFIGEFDRVYSPLVYNLWRYGGPAFQRLVRRRARGRGTAAGEGD